MNARYVTCGCEPHVEYSTQLDVQHIAVIALMALNVLSASIVRLYLTIAHKALLMLISRHNRSAHRMPVKFERFEYVT